MLRVKTKIGKSAIEGIGLIADQFIPKGTITWQYDPRFDISYDENELKELPDFLQSQFSKYSYFDHDLKKYILCSDDQRFINHSDAPNVKSTPEKDVSVQDIQPGEEITCDYTHYEHDWFERRGIKKGFK